VKYPRLVLDDWDLYGREKVFAETSAFGIVPGEAFVLEAHKLVHESALFWPEEGRVVSFVDKVPAVESVATCRRKRGGNWGKVRHRSERVTTNLPKYAKTLWEVSRDRANFLRHGFVFLLRKYG